MANDLPSTRPDPDFDPDWNDRLIYWRRALGRLRLGVEPIEYQLLRYRRATIVLTLIPCGIGLIFIALFTAFRRPDIGLIMTAVFLVPIVSLAWLDYARLRSRALTYLRESHDHDQRLLAKKTPGGA